MNCVHCGEETIFHIAGPWGPGHASCVSAARKAFPNGELPGGNTPLQYGSPAWEHYYNKLIKILSMPENTVEERAAKAAALLLFED